MRFSRHISSAPTARQFAAALLIASALQIAESLLPRLPLFPWLRLGLSWAVLMPWLFSFGTTQALILFLCRNALALSCGGQAGSAFLLSGLSGTASLLLLGPTIRVLVLRGRLGWAGAGALLACGFNLVQLGSAEMLVSHAGMRFQVGPLLIWSALSGAGIGLLAFKLWRRRDWDSLASGLPDTPLTPLASGSPLRVALCLALLVLSLFSHDLLTAALLASASLGISQARRRTLRGAWPFLIWLGWFHLRAPGQFLSWAPVTAEGLHAFALQSLRLFVFLLTTQGISANLPWSWLRTRRAIWAQGLAMAMSCTAALFPSASEATRNRATHRTWDQRFWFALRQRLALPTGQILSNAATDLVKCSTRK